MEKSSFSWLFGNKPTSSLKSGESQPGELACQPSPFQVYYDADLIQKLRDDHAKLLYLFNEIKAVSECGGYVALPKLLASFRLELQTHLVFENVKFYTYVQQLLKNDSNLSGFVSNVKKEMDNIAHAIMRFINTYSTQKIIEENITGFKNDSNEIGSTLVKRISLEETRLFSLYMPSS
jgi:regulator of sigma D